MNPGVGGDPMSKLDQMIAEVWDFRHNNLEYELVRILAGGDVVTVLGGVLR